MKRLSFFLVGVFFLQHTHAVRSGDKADAEYARLEERAKKSAGDAEAIRQELLVFQQAHPGTPQAVKAAGWLRALPSPLDKIDAKTIPPLERFDWQPKELVAVLGEHKGRQAGAVTSVIYSRSGKMLASGSTSGHVRLWDPATMRLKHTLGHHIGSYSLAFSKDNTTLVSGGGDGHARFWDVTGDKPKDRWNLKVASTPLLSVSVSANVKILAAGGSDSRVYMWDLVEDPPKETTTGDTHTGAVHAVVLLSDGKTVVSGGADKSIRIWTYAKNRLTEKAVIPEAHAGAVLSLAINPLDEKLLASGGADGAIKLWNIGGVKPALRTAMKTKDGAIHCVAFTIGGKTLASAGAAGTVRSWNVTTAGLVGRSEMEGHIAAATSVAFAPDGSTIVSGSSDWTVRQWPGVAGPKPKDKTVSKGHLSHVYHTMFSPDGKSVASGSYDTHIRLWDLPLAEPKEKPAIKTDSYVHKLAWGPDGKSIAGGGAGAAFRTYDIAGKRFIFSFQGHAGAIRDLAFAPDGVHIASCSNDKTLRLWNAKTGKEVHNFSDFESHVNGLAFAPDGKRLFCTSGYYLYDKLGKIVTRDGGYVYLDSTIRAYDLDTKKESYRWKDDKTLVSCLDVSPDGKTILAGVSDNVIRSWTPPDDKPAVFAKGGTGGVASLTISPDGRLAACYGPDYRVNLWDVASGKKLREWVLHESFGNVAFAPDSRHLTIGLATGVVYLLRLEGPVK